jgi:hypothetical protein
MPVEMDQLLDMSQDELDELFRNSPTGEIPRGETDGRVIVCPDTPFADVAGKLAHLIAWKGKVFDPDKGELLNKITPFGIQNIRAKVYKAESWFDGKECIVLDYSKTSLVAQWIRDEMREVSPGLYLGNVYWEKNRVLNFVLQFPD